MASGPMVIIAALILGVTAVMAYALYRAYAESQETYRTETQLEYEKRMKREERDYERLIDDEDDDW